MSALSLSRPRQARRAAFGQIVLNESRLARRQPASLIAGIVLPMVLLVIFSAIPAFHQPVADLGGLTTLDVYVPILIVFSLGLVALFSLPMPLTTYRELGVLRRLSTTPVPPWWLLTAQGGGGLAEAGYRAEDDQQYHGQGDAGDQAGRLPPGEPGLVEHDLPEGGTPRRPRQRPRQ